MEFYKKMYEQEKNHSEKLLNMYGAAYGESLTYKHKFEQMESSVLNMFKRGIEDYLKEKQVDPDGFRATYLYSQVMTTAIILNKDIEEVREVLDGTKKPSSGQRENGLAIG